MMRPPCAGLFGWRPGSVLQNHRIDPVSTLDAAVELGVVFAAVAQVVAPITHKQT